MLIEMALAAELCRVGKELNYKKQKTPCEVRGHYEQLGKSVYILNCRRDDVGQIEVKDDHAEILDSLSRSEKTRCPIDKKQIAQLVADYRAHDLPPKCKLEKNNGQMSFVTEITEGRCSFRMNRQAYDEFVKQTGKKPFYQCENHRFLIMHEDQDSEIFHRGSLECKAHLHTSGTTTNQDPGKYWQPEEPTFVP